MLRNTRVRLPTQGEGGGLCSLPTGPADCRHATLSCQYEVWYPVVQAHAQEPAILQATVDQAALVFKSFNSPMVGMEKDAGKRLFHRLAHRGYQVRQEFITLTLRPPGICCTKLYACPSRLCRYVLTSSNASPPVHWSSYMHHCSFVGRARIPFGSFKM